MRSLTRFRKVSLIEIKIRRWIRHVPSNIVMIHILTNEFAEFLEIDLLGLIRVDFIEALVNFVDLFHTVTTGE